MTSKLEYVREILNLDLDYNPPIDYNPDIPLDEEVKNKSIHQIFYRNLKMAHRDIRYHIEGKMDYHIVSLHSNLIFGFNEEYIYLTRILGLRLESIIVNKTEFNKDDIYLTLTYGKWLR